MGSTASFSSASTLSSLGLAGLWAPLQGFLSGCIPGPLDPVVKLQSVNMRVAIASRPCPAPPAKPFCQRPLLAARPMTCFQAKARSLNGGGATSDTPPSRLRVLREFEPGASPACAGRMVISGRMADVCAELERMTLAKRQAH